MKKILAKTACVFLGMSLLFGCGGRKNENSAGALEQDAGKGSDVWTNKGKEENSDGVGAGSGQDKNSGQGMGFGQEDDKQGTDSDTENTAPPAFPMIPMFGTSGQDTSIFDSLEAFAEYCEGEEKQALPAGTSRARSASG